MTAKFRIRTTQTSSGATAVQVVSYEKRKVVVKKHIGSAHTKEEIAALKETATDWIGKHGGQPSLFSKQTHGSLVSLPRCRFLGIRYTFAYDILTRLLTHFGFTGLGRLLTDLVIIRIIEPASKLRSVELLERYFGIHHPPRAVYIALPTLSLLKEKAEACATKIAKEEFGFDFSFVFYDVTTLYFESFTQGELRKNGFSKDNKSNQPQIVIGLVVTREGFPVAYDVFAGNTFEGNTFLPVIRRFAKLHDVKTLTVVADAAMLSFTNMTALQQEGFHHIVGARLANCSPTVIAGIASRLEKTEGKSIRLSTDKGDLVCAFSSTREAKDLREIEKQIARAQALVQNPGSQRRAKFVKAGESSFALNDSLIEKAKLLAGIKGYYTNLGSEVSDAAIIAHYHDLWHVEHAFRISKNDLETRPIFHHKTEAIKAHILLCFVALTTAKYMELRTGLSIRAITDLLWSVVDARIIDTVSDKEFTLRSEMGEDIHSVVTKILEKTGLSY